MSSSSSPPSPSPTTNEDSILHKPSSSSTKPCCAPSGQNPSLQDDSSGIPVNVFLIRMVCTVIAIAALCSYFISKHFNWFILFVAINYFQSSFSWGICPPTILMDKLGWIDHGNVYLFRKGMPSLASIDTVTA
mmetsp:Transcript_17513/g.27045  ORF Transcript_17513/g.27045 Transcript_17513/m.27045 type:complete len:133 (-) Transcript_17513:339-737(-)